MPIFSTDRQNLIILQQLMHLQLQQSEDDLVIMKIIQRRRERREPRDRRCWVRPWLGVQRRLQFGHYDSLMPELRREDPASFVNLMRMTPEMFDELVLRLSPRCTKKDTNFRKAISPGMKIAITLRHLATGDKYSSMKFNFRVPQNTISKMVPEVCKAIIAEFKDEVIQCPTTTEEWCAISEKFARRWNVPHACGALDGKHVAIRKPNSTGSLYYNYKGFFSVVMLGLVDADYKFIWLDVGGFGHQSDAQIFNESELKECLVDRSINLPAPDELPHDDQRTPYFILADDAFGLRSYLMKPYSQRHLSTMQRIYNYRISRGRRIIENAFGILAQRWQILLGTMQHAPGTVRLIIEACVCLHNLMRMRCPGITNILLDTEGPDHQIILGSWRDAGMMHDIKQIRGANRDHTIGKRQREYLMHYFNSAAGSVPWQNDMI
jgi:hypothetical protein